MRDILDSLLAYWDVGAMTDDELIESWRRQGLRPEQMACELLRQVLDLRRRVGDLEARRGNG